MCLLDFQTKFACQDYTTTEQPLGKHAWTIGNNTLNLTRLDGFVMNYVDQANGEEYIYSQPPGNNGVLCKDGDYGMYSKDCNMG